MCALNVNRSHKWVVTVCPIDIARWCIVCWLSTAVTMAQLHTSCAHDQHRSYGLVLYRLCCSISSVLVSHETDVYSLEACSFCK
jgi:hypothetical protein